MEDTQNVKFEPKPLIIRITASVLVLLIGAAVFMQLERRSESRSLSGLSLLTKRKLNLAAKYNLSADDLALLETAIKQEALAIEKDQVDIGSRWTYSNSVFFVFTIMTTIGYGHMTPQTWQGQLFCIFFSILSLPVAGLMFISIGNHLSLAIRVFVRFMEKTGPCRVVSVSAETKCTIATVILLLAMIVLGAILTSHTDDWVFVEGAYFMFISVSTIGFGDYVINDGELQSPDRSKAIAVNLTIVFITVGLCVLSSVLCSISAVIQERQTRMRMNLPIAVSNALNATNLPLITDNSISPIKSSKQSKT